MMRPMAKALAAATLVLGFSTMSPRFARAEVVIQMTGTVAEGDLNGVDLAGAEFFYTGLVTNNANIYDKLPSWGVFIVDAGFIDFGDRGVFDFGFQPSYFFLGGLENLDQVFGAVIATDFNAETGRPGNALGLIDTDPNLPDFADFDPTQLTNFGPYVQFDSGYTADSDNRFGPLVATNDFGDSLVMNDISDSGTLTITAVPEPSTFLLGTVVVAALGIRHRRRSGSVFVGK